MKSDLQHTSDAESENHTKNGMVFAVYRQPALLRLNNRREFTALCNKLPIWPLSFNPTVFHKNDSV